MSHIRSHIMVCTGTGCSSSESPKIIEAFEAELKKAKMDQEVRVVKTGCFGLCAMGPIVMVFPEGACYTKVTVDDVADGTTLETLKDAITLAEAVENAPTCPANGNASDFTKATDNIRTYADNLRNITNELDAAAKSVIASQELKLESAK